MYLLFLCINMKNKNNALYVVLFFSICGCRDIIQDV